MRRETRTAIGLSAPSKWRVVVAAMPLGQPLRRAARRPGCGRVGTARARRTRDRIREDRRRAQRGARRASGRSRTRRSRRSTSARRVEVALVHAQLAAAEAHHHARFRVRRQRSMPRQPERAQPREQLVGVRAARRRARDRAAPVATASNSRPQRSKHRDGPGDEVRSVADQTSVATSMFSCRDA